MAIKSKYIDRGNFGMKVKVFIASKNFTFKEVAEKAGMNQSQLTRFFNGDGNLPAKYHPIICEMLSIDLEDFRQGAIVSICNSTDF